MGQVGTKLSQGGPKIAPRGTKTLKKGIGENSATGFGAPLFAQASRLGHLPIGGGSNAEAAGKGGLAP
eukprot:2035519-Karenia_brevis.AAC.1